MKNSRTKRFYQQLVTAGIILTGSLQLAFPVMAAGTAGGTQINNAASATYEDSTNPGTTINSTSNTVQVTVAEVAGITVVAGTPTGATGPSGTAKPGDNLLYPFTITNTGNDPTTFHIPSTDTLVGPGTAGTPQYSTDGGTTWTNVPAAGLTTPTVPVGGTVLVRVPVTVNAGATAGTPITVTLGNNTLTSPNNENQPYPGSGSTPNDIYTVEIPGSPGQIAGGPANGQREATDKQSVTVAAVPGLVNGPSGQPAAVGPTNTNDDFTDASIPVPAGIATGAPIPTPFDHLFTNTVQNTSSAAENINLVPTAPSTPGALPDNTLVEISNTAGTQIAVYKYTAAAGFVFQPSGSFDVNGTPTTITSTGGTSATQAVQIPSVAAGTNADYKVAVQLPDNVLAVAGYPVPITAFVPSTNQAVPQASDSANITIDKTFTGFLNMLKESKVLQGLATAPAPQAADTTFSTTVKTPAPGNIVVYRITYTNIADAAVAGQPDVTISAHNVVITEDGNVAPNNWAANTTNVPSTAVDSIGTNTITFFNAGGGSATTDPTVIKYIDTFAANLAPGATGNLQIQRQVK